MSWSPGFSLFHSLKAVLQRTYLSGIFSTAPIGNSSGLVSTSRFASKTSLARPDLPGIAVPGPAMCRRRRSDVRPFQASPNAGPPCPQPGNPWKTAALCHGRLGTAAGPSINPWAGRDLSRAAPARSPWMPTGAERTSRRNRGPSSARRRRGSSKPAISCGSGGASLWNIIATTVPPASTNRAAIKPLRRGMQDSEHRGPRAQGRLSVSSAGGLVNFSRPASHGLSGSS